MLASRKIRRSVIAAAVSMSFAPHSLAAPVSWTDATSFWDVVTNWSSNPSLPGPADDVTINVAGTHTITVRGTGGPFTINSLSMPGDETLAFTGNSLTVNGAFANSAATTMTAGTLILNGVSSMASLTQDGQIAGTGNLTVTGLATITDGGHSGAATTTVQGTANISGLRLDGGRTLRNEGTVNQTGSVDMNSRRSGAAEAGNGTVLNTAGATWNSTTNSGIFIFASNQGAGDSGAGSVFTNQGTFNKQGIGTTEIRSSFVNDGTLNVQTGTLSFASGGRLTQNNVLTIAADALLDLTSNAAVTHTFNTAATTIAGTLRINGDNFLNFTQPHTLGGSGVLQHNFGQVIGSNLTLGPTLTFNVTDGGHSGAATTTVQGTANISGLRLDGGRTLRNEGTVNQTGSVDMNSRRSGAAEAGNGTVLNTAGATWNSTTNSGIFIFASNQGAGDSGAGSVFTNQGTFNKQGIGTTEIRSSFVNDGTLNVQTGTLSFASGGRLTQNNVLTIAADALLDLTSNAAVTHTFNTAATTIAGTLRINGDNFLNFTQPHTLGGSGVLQHNFGQVIGSNLTLGPTLTFNVTDGGHSGAATTTVQGTANISGLRLDGGRTLRNEGTVNQTGSVDMNSRRSGAAEAGNGTVLNTAGATWNSTTNSGIFIFASNQGAGDSGAGSVFTNQGTFNKQGIGTTEIRSSFVNDGTLNVQTGTLSFASGGRLTQNNVLTIAADALLDLTSNAAVTHTFNTAATTIAGTLRINGDNFLNFTQPHTLGGSGVLQHNFGQVIGSNLTLGPTLTFNVTDGGHSGAATTTVQGTANISGLRLDGGRTLRNEGTVNQTGSVDMNSRRSGAAEAGNGTVLNTAGATWNSTTNSGIFIFASNQGAGDSGAGSVFTNQGTFNKQGIGTTEIRSSFVNDGTLNVQTGTLSFASGGRLTQNNVLTIAADALLDLTSNAAVTHTFNTAATTIAGTLRINGDNFLNFTQPHTLGGSGVLQHNFGQVIGSNLTLGPTLTFNVTDGGHSGAATTTVQGTANISGLRLDGGRTLRNEGTVNQTGSVDMNSRRSGAAEAGNGTVLNTAGATWNSTTNSGIFIFASNQGAGDSGAGSVFTNQGTFNKQGIGTTEIRSSFVNDGTLNVQTGTVQLTSAFTNDGTIDVSSGATFRSTNATFVNAGTMTGAGTIVTMLGGELLNQGQIEPGTGIGSLRLEGDLRHADAGILGIQLASLSSSDLLNVSEDVTLDGRIVVRNAGYVPVLGDSFIVLAFDGARLGGSQFDGVITDGYGPGIVFNAIYNPNDVTLTVAAVPEPETWAMLLAGLGLVSYAVRRRRRHV